MGQFLSPRLTTIRQHSESIARRSVEILLQGIEERAQAVHEVIPFDLVLGESAVKIYAGREPPGLDTTAIPQVPCFLQGTQEITTGHGPKYGIKWVYL